MGYLTDAQWQPPELDEQPWSPPELQEDWQPPETDSTVQPTQPPDLGVTQDATADVAPLPTYEDDEGFFGQTANQKRMWERLATRNTATGANLLRMGAEADIPETGLEAVTELAEEADLTGEEPETWGALKVMGAVPRMLINSIGSGIAKGWFDIADIAMGEGDLDKGAARAAVREIQPLVQEEANRILGDPNIQYEGNFGQKIGWEIAEATVNMGGAIVVGWGTRNPGMSLGVIAGQVGGDTYGRYLDETGDHDKAMAASKFAVAAEIIPETIPVMAILKKTGAGEGVRRYLDATLGEGFQEAFTSALTQAYDAKELEGMSLKDAILAIDVNDVLYEGLIGMGVGTALATPGAVGDYIEGRRRAAADAAGEPPPETTLDEELTPDFEIKTLEENAGEIDRLLEATPDLPLEPEGGPTAPLQEGGIEFDETQRGLVPIVDEGLEQADAEMQEWAEKKAEELGWTTGEQEAPAILEGPITPKPEQPMTQLPGEEGEEGELEAEPEQPAEPLEWEPVEEAEKGPGRVVTVSTVSTEDLGDREVQVTRLEDGGVAIFDRTANTPPVEYKAEFAKDKTDEDLLKYAYEVHGWIGSKPAGPEPTGEMVAAAGAEAATSPTNDLPEPTEAQIEAGNYKKGHIAYNGLNLTIENDAGSKRRPEWPELAHHYGYIKGTEGNDGDQVDVFVNTESTAEETPVFVINQYDNQTGEFDEHKIMLGFETEEAAREGYLANYSDDWVAPEVIPRLSMDEFRSWLEKGDMQAPIDADTTQWAREGRQLEAREKASERQRARLQPDPTTDDLITWVRKMGGLNIEQSREIPEGRFSHLPRVPGLPNVQRRSGGMSLDAMAEAATEAGFIEPDELGNYDNQALINALFEGEQNPIYSKQRPSATEPEITERDFTEIEQENEQLSRLAEREEEIQKYADDMQAYVEGETTLQAVDPRIANLMATAAIYDKQATEDIISKDIPDADVVEQLNALITEKREQARQAAQASQARVAAEEAESREQAAAAPESAPESESTGRDVAQDAGESAELTEPLSMIEFPDAKDSGVRRARTWIHKTDSGKFYYSYDIMSGHAGVSWSPGDPEAAGNAYDTQAEAEMAGLDAIIKWAREQIERSDTPSTLRSHAKKLEKWAVDQLANKPKRWHEIGDLVKITDPTEDYQDFTGKVIEIQEDIDGDLIYYLEVNLPDGDTDATEGYFADQIEPITEEAAEDEAAIPVRTAEERRPPPREPKEWNVGDWGYMTEGLYEGRYVQIKSIDGDFAVVNIQGLPDGAVDERVNLGDLSRTPHGVPAFEDKWFPIASHALGEYDWYQLQKDTGAELIINFEPEHEHLMRTYVVDVYTDALRQDFEKQVYVIGAEGYRDAALRFEEANPDKYMKVTKFDADYDDPRLGDWIREGRDLDKPYDPIKPVAQIREEREDFRSIELTERDQRMALRELNPEEFAEIVEHRTGMFEEPKPDEQFNTSNDKDYMDPKEAKKIVKGWKQIARGHGGNGDKVILSLFDESGEWAKPWVEAGYDVRAIDLKIDDVDVMDMDRKWFEDHDMVDVYGVLAACPCTDFSLAGNQDWEFHGRTRAGGGGKDYLGSTHASIELVNATLDIIDYLIPAWWAIENPVGRVANVTGLPEFRLRFNPHNYGHPYTKKTDIFGEFNGDLPQANIEPTEGSYAWNLGSRDEQVGGERSKTFEGFAYAFYVANNSTDNPGELMMLKEYTEALPASIDPELVEKIKIAARLGMYETTKPYATRDSYMQDIPPRLQNALNQNGALMKAYQDGAEMAHEDWRFDGVLEEHELELLQGQLTGDAKVLEENISGSFNEKIERWYPISALEVTKKILTGQLPDTDSWMPLMTESSAFHVLTRRNPDQARAWAQEMIDNSLDIGDFLGINPDSIEKHAKEWIKAIEKHKSYVEREAAGEFDEQKALRMFDEHRSDLSKRTPNVKALRQMAEWLELPKSGNKSELIARLTEWKRNYDYDRVPNQGYNDQLQLTSPVEYTSAQGLQRWVIEGVYNLEEIPREDRKQWRQMAKERGNEIAKHHNGSVYKKVKDMDGISTEAGWHFLSKEDAEAFWQHYRLGKSAQPKLRMSRSGMGSFRFSRDLFGDDTTTAQQVEDLRREKDRKRSGLDKPEPSLSQTGEDLFNEGGRLEGDMFYELEEPAVEADLIGAPSAALENARMNADNLNEIELKMELDDTVVKASAKFWLDDIEGRILNMNKLRDCL